MKKIKKILTNLFFSEKTVNSNKMKDFYQNYTPKVKEQMPNDCNVFNSTIPGNFTMKHWMEGGWSSFIHKN